MFQINAPKPILQRHGESFKKIGFLAVPLPGHIDPMTALARALQSQGHNRCVSRSEPLVV